MEAIAHFLFEIGILKRTPRSGFWFLGSGQESVAEHSFRTAMIGFALAQQSPESVDVGRLVSLCLLHDVPEARTSDLNYVHKRYVQVDEQRAIDDLAARLPFGEQYAQLLEEFCQGDTAEARLARDADQLEMILALKEYQDLGNPYAQKWYPHVKARLQTELAQELADTIWETDSTQWWAQAGDRHWWIHGKEAPADSNAT